MTDPDAPTAKLPPLPKRPAKPRLRKPGPFGVIAGSIGLFFVVTALLAVQMRRGADPALGAPKPVLAAVPAPRQILVRRVIVTRIVEARPPRVRRPAPAPSVPAAPSPPVAPSVPAAPAPAPLTTRSS